MTDEGYIKFACKWHKKSVKIEETDFKSINSWRDRFYRLNLIGAYKDKIGYGNLSLRLTVNAFLITGSATGEKPSLSISDYALVNGWNIEKNELSCQGLIKASSESLSHAALYDSDPEINAVIHVHSKEMWDFYLNKLPTSPTDIPYGTPEMAYSLQKLLKEDACRQTKIMVMGGHIEGIIAFGHDIEEAGSILLKYFSDL